MPCAIASGSPAGTSMPVACVGAVRVERMDLAAKAADPFDLLWDAADRRADDRRAARQRFEDDVRKRVYARAMDIQVGSAVVSAPPPPDPSVRHEPDLAHSRCDRSDRRLRAR